MEFIVFQCKGIWLCIYLVGIVMDFDCADDTCFLSGGQNSGIFADSILAVGDICRVSELYGMAAELEKRKTTLCNIVERSNFLFKYIVQIYGQFRHGAGYEKYTKQIL